MKKMIIIPTLLGAMGIGGMIATVGGNSIGSADSSNLLSVSEIEKKAIQVVDGTVKEIELEKENGKKVYEVDVITDKFEYDLKFDAITGELLKKKKDDLDDDLDDQPNQVQASNEQSTNNAPATSLANTKEVTTNQVQSKEAVKQTNNHQATVTKPSTNTNANSPRKLSVSEIKTKALSVVNGNIVEVDFDDDDNRYEVEIITNHAEYELEFDAYSGALLKKEVDELDDHDDDNFDDDDGWDD